MAVSQDRALAQVGFYTQTEVRVRGKAGAAVGWLHVDAGATGDASGGSMQLTLQGRQQEFGFKWLWLPLHITFRDDLASAETVVFRYKAAGMRVLNFDLEETIQAVRASGQNRGTVIGGVLPVYTESLVAVDLLEILWATNTDTKLYHLHAFGPVFDREILAKGAGYSEMLAGLR